MSRARVAQSVCPRHDPTWHDMHPYCCIAYAINEINTLFLSFIRCHKYVTHRIRSTLHLLWHLKHGGQRGLTCGAVIWRLRVKVGPLVTREVVVISSMSSTVLPRLCGGIAGRGGAGACLLLQQQLLRRLILLLLQPLLLEVRVDFVDLRWGVAARASRDRAVRVLVEPAALLVHCGRRNRVCGATAGGLPLPPRDCSEADCRLQGSGLSLAICSHRRRIELGARAHSRALCRLRDGGLRLASCSHGRCIGVDAQAHGGR